MKKDKTIVIKIIDIVLHASSEITGIKLFNTGANWFANASEANALDKKPARVIPI